VRLSELLDAVTDDDVAELVVLSALWAFAPDPGDGSPDAASEVDLLASGLEAGDDGTELAHAWAGGRDLVITRQGSAS
jgi:hypothetical protein